MIVGNLPPRARLPLLLLGFLALVAGVGAGLSRFGWPVPDMLAGAASLHAPLMLCGFFGTVIALERAVALGRGWAYAAPVLAGAGTLALLLAPAATLPRAAVTLGSVAFAVASLRIAQKQRALFTLVLLSGAVAWVAGNVAWLQGSDASVAQAWWFAFLVQTIAAERLELARFMPPSATAVRVFAGIVAVMLLGLVLVSGPLGRTLFGFALVALAVWLFRYDIARRTIRARGLTRYVAACLLAGYAWLAFGGTLVATTDALVPGGNARDAAVHALGLGFVFSMVMGHAPIIVPAVLRTRLAYRSAFYVPLALLHVSLLVRITGDAISLGVARSGALGNAFALATFVVVMLASALHPPRSERPPEA